MNWLIYLLHHYTLTIDADKSEQVPNKTEKQCDAEALFFGGRVGGGVVTGP